MVGMHHLLLPFLTSNWVCSHSMKLKKVEEFLLKGHQVQLSLLFRRSKVIKPAEREERAFELLREASKVLEKNGREVADARKVMPWCVRSMFIPTPAAKGNIKPSDSFAEDKAIAAAESKEEESVGDAVEGKEQPPSASSL